APAGPAAKVTTPITMALAARTWPRRGLAASVTAIRPRWYSAPTNIAAATASAISPANAPVRVSASGMPPPRPPTAGAMSPEPLTVTVPPVRWKPPVAWRGPLPAPVGVPVHAAAGPGPRRAVWAEGGGASAGPALGGLPGFGRRVLAAGTPQRRLGRLMRRSARRLRRDAAGG